MWLRIFTHPDAERSGRAGQPRRRAGTTGGRANRPHYATQTSDNRPKGAPLQPPPSKRLRHTGCSGAAIGIPKLRHNGCSGAAIGIPKLRHPGCSGETGAGPGGRE